MASLLDLTVQGDVATIAVMAAEDKHEEAFLLTQQADEARHAQHFNRLYEEVFDYGGGFEDRLERAREDMNDDYFTLFDGHLVDAHRALLDDPGSLEAKVDFITIYHMSQEMNEFAFTALSRRLKVIGIGLPAVAG